MAIGTPTIFTTGTVVGASGTSFNIAATSTAPSSSRLFVVCGWLSDPSAVTLTVTGASLSWAAGKTQTGAEGTTQYALAVWSADAPSGAANPTLTCAFSGTVVQMIACAFYCTGIATSSPVDGAGAGQFLATPDGAGAWTSTAATTTNADDLLIGAAMADNSGSGRTSTATGTLNNELFDFDSAAAIHLTATYAIVASTGTYTATGTYSNPADFADIGIIAAYKAAGAAAAASLLAPPFRSSNLYSR